MKRLLRTLLGLAFLASLLLPLGTHAAEAPSVRDTMDAIVARLYATFDQQKLLQLDERTVEGFVTPEERHVLATKYWCFDVNVPVTVSVMRDAAQAVIPFWLPEAGFKKTDLIVKNEEYTYEVWQKSFDPGRVELGINGFDKHRPHYFVAVGPKQPGAKLELSHFVPADQNVTELREGAFVYYDWSDLLLTEVPDSMRGQALLPTIRGRAREAQIIQAFRETPFPSSPKPDLVVLTWSEDPRTTETIQWRTDPSVNRGVVRYHEKQNGVASPWTEGTAESAEIADKFVMNDQRVHHFTATLRGLRPATTYVYSVGSPDNDQWSQPAEFTTAPDAPAAFSFVFLSDTHSSPASGKLLAAALERHPEIAFCTISGDLVGTGQYREDWDKLLEYSRVFSTQRPLMPALGNHDAIDGLGPQPYLSLFALPENGPKKLEAERAYSFVYGNALFIMLDVTAPIEDQTQWLEEQLAGSRATWKIAVFHFPAYAPDDDTPEIRREWVPLFDKYHVDLALSGHVHHYMRTLPMRDGKPVASPADGTIYLITVSLPDRDNTLPKPAYAAALSFTGAPFYQTFSFDGNRLVSRCCSMDGKIQDEFTIAK